MIRSKIFKTFIKSLLFLLVLCFSVSVINKILIRKDEYSRYNEFYKEKDSFDVLFFGSSRMLDAIQPMEIWEEYGIKSYNLAQHSESLGRNYWSVLNAIQYNKPKVIVVDISLFAGDYYVNEDSSSETKAYLHNMLDHMPLSPTKIKITNALCDKSLRSDYLFPLSTYHSRWSQLTPADFSITQPPDKGAEIRQFVSAQEYNEWPTDEEAEVFMPDSVNLDKLIKLCREEDIELVCICLPVPEASNYGFYTTINSFEKYLNAENITFINYMKNNITDYSVCFSDPSHVNVAGAKIISLEIGKYLSENFVFDHSNNQTDDNWNNTFQNYIAEKGYRIIIQENDPQVLLINVLCDQDYSCEIEYRNTDVLDHYGITDMIPLLEQNSAIEEKDDISYDLKIRVIRNDLQLTIFEKEYVIS